MDIIAITYHNIGPFRQQLHSIFFHKGKFLIKAPIGSGKSFLFFDGPIYGLYKAFHRRLLNINEKEGFIKIVFTIDDVYYLLIRQLKKGKSKDLCTSQLFRVEGDTIANIFNANDVLQPNNDIEKLLREDTTLALEEISFKNEIDLQKTVEDILPPKEVFLSTIFLMQDADNIFELTPADRLTILKNVFGLLGIDDAKDVIADKRRAIQTEKKITADTSRYDTKLKQLLQSYVDAGHELQNNPHTQEIIQPYYDHITQQARYAEKVNITDFTTDVTATQLIETVRNTLDQKQLEQQHLRHQQQQYTKQLNELSNDISKHQQQYETIKKDITSLDKQIKQLDPKQLQQLKQQKQEIRQQQEHIQNSIDTKKIYTFWQQHKNTNLFDEFSLDQEQITITSVYQCIQHLIQQGKFLRQSLQTTETKLVHLQSQQTQYDKEATQRELKEGTDTRAQWKKEITHHQQTIEQNIQSIQKEIDNLTDKKKTYEEQLHTLDKKITQFQKDVAIAGTFFCKKIDTDCPFIEKINAGTLNKLHKQQDELITEKEQLQQRWQQEKIDTHIEEGQKKLHKYTEELHTLDTKPEKILHEFIQQLAQKKKTREQTNDPEKIKKEIATLEKEQQNLQTSIGIITAFMQDIDRKNIQSQYQQQQSLNQHIQQLDQQIIKHEEAQQHIEQYQRDKDKQEQSLLHIQHQIDTHTTKKANIQKELQYITAQLEKQQSAARDKADTATKILETALRDIGQLVDDFKHAQHKIKQLATQEKVVNNLYQIFSKELLLIVLEDSLSTLTDVINSFLSQVVQYQLKLELEKTSGDKLELNAYVVDDKGQREVKTLSGGQKTVLKLIRMLAVSAYVRSPVLFLDETINNLDADTVGKVADMLSDFVKQHDIKLYTVTHSHQIQSMDIWDDVINIAIQQ